MTRVVLFTLLSVVAMAAAILSFSALRALGLSCGFDPRLAWLVPVVVDAGAAAGSVSWLSSPPGLARMFGRRLAIVLLAASVIGNGIAHVLEAYRLDAAWWLVVAVSALAPIILGAVVHLVVLSVQDGVGTADPLDAPGRFPESGSVLGDATRKAADGEFFPEPGTRTIFGDPRKSQVGQLPASSNLDEHGADEGWETAPTPDLAGVHKIDDGRSPTDRQSPVNGRAAELIAEGAGRRRLSKELGVSEYEARALLGQRRNGVNRHE